MSDLKNNGRIIDQSFVVVIVRKNMMIRSTSFRLKVTGIKVSSFTSIFFDVEQIGIVLQCPLCFTYLPFHHIASIVFSVCRKIKLNDFLF